MNFAAERYDEEATRKRGFSLAVIFSPCWRLRMAET